MNFRKILSLLALILISLSLFSCKIVLPGTSGDKELHNLIEQEYNDLSNYKKTEHTKWTFNAYIKDMSSTTYNENYNSYEIRMILDLDGLAIGIYDGQVNGKYPTNIEGLEIGKKVTVTGVIDEHNILFCGGNLARIRFTKPEISWEGMKNSDDEINNGNNGNNNNNFTGSSVNFAIINDTHGAFTDSTDGVSIARIGTLIDNLEQNKGDYIKIANGDILQGSYLSSKTYGYALIESLNLMEFDAFVIGNHEFDWGLDKIEKYKDNDLSNGEANFPFLGANIYIKGTTTRPDWIDPYTIIDYSGLKVGIIGVLGEDQEGDILKSNVEDYEFVEPTNIIKEYAYELRNEKDCDVVVLASHDYDETLAEYETIANFNNTEKIDAIFCGHLHRRVQESVVRRDGISIPIVQNRHKNNTLQEVILYLNENNEMNSYSNNVYYGSNYSPSNKFSDLNNKYSTLINESAAKIGYTSSTLSEELLGSLSGEAMIKAELTTSNDYKNVSLGVINTGGVRSEITAGNITVGSVFNTFPFENEIILVRLKGSYVKSIINSSSFYTFGMEASEVNSDNIYVVAVVDYAFYDKDYYFSTNLGFIDTDVLMRDVLIELLREKY